MSSDKTFTISISTHTIFKILVIGLVLAFLWYIKEVLLILFLAILLAALIDPTVDWLQARRIPRSIGVLAVYVVLFGILAASFVLIIPVFVDQLHQLTINFADAFTRVATSVERLINLGSQFGVSQAIAAGLQSLQDAASDLAGGVVTTIGNVIGGLAALFIVIVLAFYMVVEEDSWRRLFRRLAPDEYQPYVIQLFTKMQLKIGLWLRGQLMLMLVVGVSSYLGLTILGVPYALVLGFFAGVMEMVPYAGPIVSAVPALVIAFSLSPLKAFMVLLLCILIQQIENHVLVPKIMQKTTGLNPIASIIALLIGFKIAGIPGAMLAIPVATMASVFIYDILGTGNPAEKIKENG